MEISSTAFNPNASQQSRTRSESEETLEAKLKAQLKNEVAPNPEDKAFRDAQKVESTQAAQQQTVVENREQEEKRQGRAIDVTV